MHPDLFKFFTLNNIETWKTGYNNGIEIHSKGHLNLWPIPSVSAIVPILTENSNPAAIAIKDSGTILILDSTLGKLHEFDLHTQITTFSDCTEESQYVIEQFSEPRGMAVCEDMLYVTDSGHHRLIAFYLDPFQIRFIVGKTDQYNQPIQGSEPGVFNCPIAVAVDNDNFTYVVDSGNKRIQKFNQLGKLVHVFGNQNDEQLDCPIDIAIDNEGYIYILDLNKPYVLKFDKYGSINNRLCELNKIHGFTPTCLAIDSRKTLYVGSKTHIQIFDNKGINLGKISDFKGDCKALTVDNEDNMYAAFQIENSAQLAILKSGQTYIQAGNYFTTAFDSTVPECQWHRIVLDAIIPEKTRIEIYYYGSDENKTPGEIRSLHSDLWQQAVTNPEDTLLQDARGRYLWLRFHFVGDGYHTPILEQFKIFFPRLSYLRYLPAIFQENTTSKDFLERYLSLFETFLLQTEETISSITRYIDPFATDSGFIPWLASWLAIAIDENWEENQQRIFISKAYDLFKQRGTKTGLENIIELYTGYPPVIIEHYHVLMPMIFGLRSQLGMHTVLGKMPKGPLELASQSTISEFALRDDEIRPEEPFEFFAYNFTIIVNTTKLKSPSQLKTIIKIIEDEKPAHTHYFLRIPKPEFRVELNTFAGVGTIVGKPHGTMKLGDHSQIGIDTILKSTQRPPGRTGKQPEIGVNTILN